MTPSDLLVMFLLQRGWILMFLSWPWPFFNAFYCFFLWHKHFPFLFIFSWTDFWIISGSSLSFLCDIEVTVDLFLCILFHTSQVIPLNVILLLICLWSIKITYRSWRFLYQYIHVQLCVCDEVGGESYHDVKSRRQTSLCLCWGSFHCRFWRHSSHLEIRSEWIIHFKNPDTINTHVDSRCAADTLYPARSGRRCPCRSWWAPLCPRWECRYDCSGDLWAETQYDTCHRHVFFINLQFPDLWLLPFNSKTQMYLNGCL